MSTPKRRPTRTPTPRPPGTPAADAPPDIDPHDPSRAGKWWYSEEEAEVVFPTLTPDPHPRPGGPPMTPPRPQKRYRCRSCGRELPAWLPVAKRPWAPMLLHHLYLIHPAEFGPYLERMRTEDIDTVAGEAYEVVEEP